MNEVKYSAIDAMRLLSNRISAREAKRNKPPKYRTFDEWYAACWKDIPKIELDTIYYIANDYRMLHDYFYCLHKDSVRYSDAGREIECMLAKLSHHGSTAMYDAVSEVGGYDARFSREMDLRRVVGATNNTLLDSYVRLFRHVYRTSTSDEYAIGEYLANRLNSGGDFDERLTYIHRPVYMPTVDFIIHMPLHGTDHKFNVMVPAGVKYHAPLGTGHIMVFDMNYPESGLVKYRGE